MLKIKSVVISSQGFMKSPKSLIGCPSSCYLRLCGLTGSQTSGHRLSNFSCFGNSRSFSANI